MQVRRGQGKIRFGEGNLQSAIYIDKTKNWQTMLCVIELQRLLEMFPDYDIKAKRQLGIPIYIADNGEGEAIVYPVPIKNCEIRIRWISYHEA